MTWGSAVDTGAGGALAIEAIVGCVIVTIYVEVAVAIDGGVKVMVTNVMVSLVEGGAAIVGSEIGAVISMVVSGVVERLLVADGVVVAGAVKLRTLDAIASSVHSTTTPSVDFIGMAKHSEPLAHTLITKLPASLQVPKFPARQAILPGVHDEEKLSVEKKLL